MSENHNRPESASHSLSRRGLIGGGIAAVLAASFASTVSGASPAFAASTYIFPTSSRTVSDDFAAHVRRGSVNPGTDYVCARNTPVVASRAGTVTLADNDNGGSGGRMVIINHGGGVTTEYLHFQQVQVAANSSVAQGQQIGLSGGSGYGSDSYYGPHVHIALKLNGTNVDFENYVGTDGPAQPSGAAALRQVVTSNGVAWQSLDTQIILDPSHISAVDMGLVWPQLMIAQAGALYQVYGDTAGWHVGNTGVPIAPSSMSAVNMGGQWPQVMSIENGYLYQTYGNSAGWQKASTSLNLIGQISAVNMGGQWPTVMLAQGGVLYRVFGDAAGWHVQSTGIAAAGQISAVNMGGSLPQVMMIESGYLYQIWADAAGWHKASTGLNLIGGISAVNAGGAWPTVMLDQGGVVYRVFGDTGGWHVASTGVTGTGRFSAVQMGSGYPQVLKIG